MADKKVILEVELIEGNANSKLNELKASLQSLDKTHKDYKPTLQLIAQAERDLSKAQQNRILVEKGLANSAVKVEKETKKTAKQMKQLSSDTGASTSASLELGRVFSDMPYGIRGVANNIQQLASNLFFMSKKTDEATGKTVGFRGAFKGLGKSLLGPAGVLVAFQAFTAFLDWYSNRTGKAKKATADFSALVSNQASKLMILSDVLKSTNTSLSEKRKLVSNVNFEFKGLNLVLDKQGQLTETSQKNIDKLTASLVKNAKAQAVLNQITEEQSKIVEIELERSKRISEAGVGAFEGTLEDLENQRKKYIDRNTALIDKSDLSEKMKKKALDNYMKSSTMKKFDALRDFRKKDVENAEKSIAKIISIINKEGLLSIYDSKAVKKVGLKLEAKGVEDVVSGLQELVGGKPVLIPITFNQISTDDIADFIKNYKVLMSGVTDFVDGEFERQLTTEQNKTNALNEELNNRLLNENLSKDQRASIQNEIAQNDDKLRIKQDAIKKKQFKQQKAFNISMAIISTYSAAAKTLNDTKGGSFARIAGMVAVIGSGLAQVAAISRQKFQSSSAQSPINTSSQGGSGAGGARAEPSFNIVGRSQDNILLDAIQSQFDKPLKAYVVARDITNQQQLDGVISTSAST